MESRKKERRQRLNDNFDKEIWKEKKKEERKRVFDVLDRQTDSCFQNPEELDVYLHVAARFDQYSASNCLLIAAQKPDARELCSCQAWKERGMKILRGQRPILLIEKGRPMMDRREKFFWDVKYFYDVTQTTGTVSKQSKKSVEESSLELMDMCPCKVIVETDAEICKDRLAWFDKEANLVFLSPEGSEEERAGALAVAAAEAMLNQSENTYRFEEFIAQCAGCILCYRYGISSKDISVSIPEELRQENASKKRQNLRFVRETIYNMETELEMKERERKQQRAVAR